MTGIDIMTNEQSVRILRARLASVEARRDQLWFALKYHSTPKVEGSLEEIHKNMPEGTACALCGWAKPEAEERPFGRHIPNPNMTKCEHCGLLWKFAGNSSEACPALL